MSTVFWLPSTDASDVSPTPSATDWDGHINAGQRLKMVLDRIDSSYSTVTYAPDSADHLTDVATMHSQYVSQILPPQAIAAQKIIFGIRGLESNALNNQYEAWKLYCVKADGSSALGTLVAWFKSALSEMATVITGYAEQKPGSAVTLYEPWRLVLEFGSDGLPTTGGGRHNMSFEVGDTLATGSLSMPQNDDTSTCAPMLVFSNDLVTKFTGRGRAGALIGI